MSAASPDPRLRLAASLACFRDGSVLIARRARGQATGLWSLPGGGVEFGERAEDAAIRELHEETGARATVAGFVDMVEMIEQDPDGAAVRHAVILAFAGRWLEGEPQPGDEADAIAWASPDEISGYDTTPGLEAIVRKAAEMVA